MFKRKSKIEAVREDALKLIDELGNGYSSGILNGKPSNRTTTESDDCEREPRQKDMAIKQNTDIVNTNRSFNVSATNILDEYNLLLEEFCGLLACGDIAINDINQELRIKHAVWYSYAMKSFMPMSSLEDFNRCYSFLLVMYDDVVYSLNNEPVLSARLNDYYNEFYNLIFDNLEFKSYVQEQEKAGYRGIPILEKSL